MKKLTLWCIALLCTSTTISAQELATEDTLTLTAEELQEYEAYQLLVDSIEQQFTYEYGTIQLSKNGEELATLEVPKGYKYLNPEQTNYVLVDLWGNPPQEEQSMGMLLPENMSPLSQDLTFGVEIDYSDEGYINDEDAADIDYDELLEEMQNDAEASNKMRIEQGYGSIELVGWAASPFYDAATKKLHWAKEIKFDESEYNTLNYNIRVLGRGGFINLNAIGDMEALPVFEQDIEAILGSVNFIEGQKYENFDSSIDKVAAYGVGGLIAGKVLAKAGFFAILLKFWKFILIGVAGAWMGVKRFFGGNNAA